jgi:hypothetical protein
MMNGGFVQENEKETRNLNERSPTPSLNILDATLYHCGLSRVSLRDYYYVS